MTVLLVACAFGTAAGLGAVTRWWASVSTHRRWHDHLPLPTLVVNIFGSFALACLVGSGVGSEAHTVMGTGFLGAFTTFSTLVRESHALEASGNRGRAIGYIALSTIGGVGAALAGLALTQQ